MGLFNQSNRSNEDSLSHDIEAFAAMGGSEDQVQGLQNDLDAASKYNKLRYGALAVFLGLVGFIFVMSSL